MRLLLDTHTFLWLCADEQRLSQQAREAIVDPQNALWLSLASVWEMAIKYSLGRLELPTPAIEFVAAEAAANSIQLLPIELSDLARVAELPFHHRDPFDRLLAAQAWRLDAALVSLDTVFDRYAVNRLW